MDRDYLRTVQDTLPADLKRKLEALPESLIALVDTLLRFVAGGDCPADASESTRQQWPSQQAAVIQQLHTQTNGKRARNNDTPEDEPTTKKSRTSPPAADPTDTPLYTLHALSISSPLRKKLDIRIHERSLRLINPSTQAIESTTPLSALKRAFLLPTRGKTKSHWSVVLLSSDTPAPSGKAAAACPSTKENVQIVFGVDAAPPAYSTTDHTTDSPAQANHPKGTPILPFLRAFLSHLPVPLIEPDTSVFKSAVATDASGGPVAGVQGYRSAKEGTLWFLPGGVLWDGRPCEFWSVKDLVPGTNAAGEAGTGSDGVRLVSATGRTCSVFVRRRIVESEKNDEDEEEDDEEIKCTETDFGMVDGKEQDGISQWVKRHKHLFGKDEEVRYGYVNGKIDLKGKGKATAPPAEDSDEDDSDFVDESESDGGSASSGSDDEGSDGENHEEGEGSEGEDKDGEGGDDDEGMDEDEELDPARHPLMRPGAMPRMSKAAMDAAVGIVLGDMVGGSNTHQSSGKARKEAESDEEEDELED
ncbi:hypothetical protein PHLGIDRAFT_322934 [Phlebiopsis gigantea 11061_1 CR5-6]|uniref:Histone chaperone RTT106/FACT complex subunit SPT16-like middle domain-containing protein n=1 Tax=Phlebiopsis gigantea (strain 11061_1 CR5-6) TaxID=745531 RepID=A0A0C3PQL7_PHLG1|nr:hypothetical protein PHLGIDRAFT_322934 [Phlebiopsis gigantea 11061_1 CR5-6]